MRGPDVPETIWPVEMYASDWVTPCASGAYGIMESSVRITGTLVLSLLWWKDERQLLDLDGEAEDY